MPVIRVLGRMWQEACEFRDSMVEIPSQKKKQKPKIIKNLESPVEKWRRGRTEGPRGDKNTTRVKPTE